MLGEITYICCVLKISWWEREELMELELGEMEQRGVVLVSVAGKKQSGDFVQE